MIDVNTDKGRIISAALRLAAEHPWDDVSLREIADTAGTDLAHLREHFDGKSAIVAGLMRAIDDDVLAKAPKPDPSQSHRDALFEVIMNRFDALQPHKAAMRSIAHASSLDPVLLRALLKSQAWMLQAAGIDTDGLDGGARTAGLAGVYASVFQTWLQDDDPGMARTMAVLDRRLRRAERAVSTVNSLTSACRGVFDMLRPGRPKTRDAAGDDYTPPPSEPDTGGPQASTTV